jgi:hypothetical protein
MCRVFDVCLCDKPKVSGPVPYGLQCKKPTCMRFVAWPKRYLRDLKKPRCSADANTCQAKDVPLVLCTSRRQSPTQSEQKLRSFFFLFLTQDMALHTPPSWYIPSHDVHRTSGTSFAWHVFASAEQRGFFKSRRYRFGHATKRMQVGFLHCRP